MKRKHTTILALIGVIITTGCLWYGNRSPTPKEASWEDILAAPGPFFTEAEKKEF